MVFSRPRKRACHLSEIGNVEGYEYPTLLARHPKQLSVLERLQRSSAGCGNYVMSALLKPGSNVRGDVSVKQDSVWHLGVDHFHPWQLFLYLLRGLVVQLEKSANLLRVCFRVCSCNLDGYQRQLRKVLAKF